MQNTTFWDVSLVVPESLWVFWYATNVLCNTYVKFGGDGCTIFEAEIELLFGEY